MERLRHYAAAILRVGRPGCELAGDFRVWGRMAMVVWRPRRSA